MTPYCSKIYSTFGVKITLKELKYWSKKYSQIGVFIKPEQVDNFLPCIER